MTILASSWNGDVEMNNGSISNNKQLHQRKLVVVVAAAAAASPEIDSALDDDRRMAIRSRPPSASTTPTSLNSPSNTSRRRRRKQKKKLASISIPLFSLYCGILSLLLLQSYFHFITLATTTAAATAIHVPSKEEINSKLAAFDKSFGAIEDPPAILHIVNTRFMQEQGTLEILGMARYHQFMTFCYPSVIHQSSQDFFWIIKTDPHLSLSLQQKMIQVLQPHDNFYLVASNQNFMINKQNGSWRDGGEGYDLLQSKIYTGNITKLHQAIALRNDRPILETRLDADDGFHQMYIQYLQNAAMYRFQEGQASSSSPDWLYWCIRRHLEWHTPKDNSTTASAAKRGILLPIQHNQLCITPGMTVGYNLKTTNVPVYPHDTLFRQLSQRDAITNETTQMCYGPGKNYIKQEQQDQQQSTDSSSSKKKSRFHQGMVELPCLDMAEDFLLGAIRSRTWTSAGMSRVGAEKKQMGPSRVVTKLWKLAKERFGVTPERVQELVEYFQQHTQEIALENLQGQCTTGHSCKDSAKQELQRYIALP